MKLFSFNNTSLIRVLLLAGFLASITGVWAQQDAQTNRQDSASIGADLSPRTFSGKLRNVKFSGQYLAPITDQDPDESDSQAVWNALGGAKPKAILEAANELETFIRNNPSSPWTPALRGSLAKAYSESGRYTPALEHYESCWEATKNMTGNGKAAADFALAHYTRLLGKLGRMDKLAVIFEETKGRQLDGGYLQVIYDETRQAYFCMSRFPSSVVGCGGYALAHVAKSLNASPEAIRSIMSVAMPAAGYSMKSLAELASQYGLDMVPARRLANNDSLPVPSVLHLQQNHYVAVLAKNGSKYLVADLLRERPKWMNADDLDSEASGAFLIPRSQLSNKWTELSSDVAKTILGKGYYYVICYPLDGGVCTNICDCPNGSPNLGGDDCSSCWTGGDAGNGDVVGDSSIIGMPRWAVSEPFINLWILDEPLGYQPAYGPRVALRLAYKQRPDRDFDPNIFGFGKNWNCDWLGYVVPSEDNVTNVTWYRPGGGTYDFVADNFSLGYQTSDRMTILYTNSIVTGYLLTHRTGATEKYTVRHPNPSITNYFLSEIADPQGRATVLKYATNGSALRLTQVIDATGLPSNLSYTNVSYPNMVTKVTDAYGMVCQMVYDNNGYLTDIYDVNQQPLHSSFTYDHSTNDPYNSITGLVTPYGTTTFAHTYVDGVDNYMVITDPMGDKQMFQLRNINMKMYDLVPGADGYHKYADAANVPTNVLSHDIYVKNEYMEFRNSYYWGKRQMSNLRDAVKTNLVAETFANMTTNDFAIARMRHWYHHDLSGISSTLAMERKPSPSPGTISGQPATGKMTWYNIGGSEIYLDINNQLTKNVIAVMPDGTQKYVVYNRDSLGNVTNRIETYSVGDSISTRNYWYTYKSNGIDLESETGPDGRVIAGYGYNNYHQVLWVTNANNEVTSYVYNDNHHQLQSVTYPSGLRTIYTYDDATGQLKSIRSCAVVGGVEVEQYGTNSFTYNDKGLIRSNTNPHGLSVEMSYDYLQRITSIYYPDQSYQRYTYTNLSLVRFADRMTNSTLFQYDSVRRLTTITNALGKLTSFDYCSCGGLSSIQDALNREVQFFYDNQGNKTNIIYPGDYSITNYYDSVKRLINLRDSAGANVYVYYNQQGLITGISNKVGWVAHYGYDLSDRLTSVTDANGVVISLEYDDLDRLRSRSCGSTTESWFYTPNIGPATLYSNQISQVTTFAYDARGLKTNDTVDGITISYEYNPAGDLTKITDGNNHVTSWNYDVYGRILAKYDNSGAPIFTNDFYANGWLKTRWTAGKGTSTYIYDAMGNLRTNSNASYTRKYIYDDLNRLATNSVDYGFTNVFTYDDAGFLQSEGGLWPNDTVNYTHTNGLLAAITLAQPSGSWSQTYGYDGAKRLQTLVSPAGTFRYDYSPGGLNRRPPGSRLPDQLNFPGGYITNFYDAIARLQSTTLKNNTGTVLDEQDYLYNNAHQRARITDGYYGNYIEYLYDIRGQLTNASGKVSSGTLRPEEQWSYVYDNAGNLQRRGQGGATNIFTPSSSNTVSSASSAGTITVTGVASSDTTQVTVNGNLANLYNNKSFSLTGLPLTNNTISAIAVNGVSSASHTIALNANTSFSASYDANGNLTNDGRRLFFYDADNQLVQVIVTNSATNSVQSGFKYDGLMRRRVRTEAQWISGVWVTNTLVRYIYDGMRVIQERDANNNVLATYTWGNDLSGSLQGAGGVGGLLARTHPGPHHFYYHSDGNGNITAAINEAKNLVAQYRYDPFGNMIYSKGALADINLYRFSSKEYSTNSGLYYYGFRFYDPNLQRWLNRDPIEEDGGLNLYGFVGNDPINWIDYLGFQAYTMRYPQPPMSEPMPFRWGSRCMPPEQRVEAYENLERNGTFSKITGIGAPFSIGPARSAPSTSSSTTSPPGPPTSGSGQNAPPSSVCGCPAPPTLPVNSFSIIGWTGYPAGLPKPPGPFRLLEGAEYDAARAAANQANRAMHQANPALGGFQIHEIQPVKFGGSPTDPLNKIPLTPQQHSPATIWWRQLQRNLEGPP